MCITGHAITTITGMLLLHRSLKNAESGTLYSESLVNLTSSMTVKLIQSRFPMHYLTRNIRFPAVIIPNTEASDQDSEPWVAFYLL